MVIPSPNYMLFCKKYITEDKFKDNMDFNTDNYNSPYALQEALSFYLSELDFSLREAQEVMDDCISFCNKFEGKPICHVVAEKISKKYKQKNSNNILIGVFPKITGEKKKEKEFLSISNNNIDAFVKSYRSVARYRGSYSGSIVKNVIDAIGTNVGNIQAALRNKGFTYAQMFLEMKNIRILLDNKEVLSFEEDHSNRMEEVKIAFLNFIREVRNYKDNILSDLSYIQDKYGFCDEYDDILQEYQKIIDTQFNKQISDKE